MSALAEANGATKRFGSFTAVDHVDLQVGRGEILGLLGANGAGKTTLIRLFLGLLRADYGTVLLFGQPPSLATRRKVGYVPQTLGLYSDLTVEENWAFNAAAFGTSSTTIPAHVTAWKAQLVADLPLGEQRQVAFALALSHHPDLLVLDEPTSGVGPLGRVRLWESIHSAADEGAGVLVTTHNMEEAEECDRLLVMADGVTLVDGTPADIIEGHSVVEILCPEWRKAFAVLDEQGILAQLAGGALRVVAEQDTVRRILASAGIEAQVGTVPANLEEAFVAIISRPDSP